MTQAEFITAYERELLKLFPWAQDDVKRARFMASVRGTIAGEFWTWNHDGEAVKAAWRSLGGKGTPTMKALRALQKD